MFNIRVAGDGLLILFEDYLGEQPTTAQTGQTGQQKNQQRTVDLNVRLLPAGDDGQTLPV